MTDPKDELGARFENRRAGGADTDNDGAESTESDQVDHSDDASDTSNTSNMSNAGNTKNSDNSDNSDNSNNSDNTGSTSKPGPDPDPTSTRNRRQVPMYLPDEKADRINQLYDQLDGRSKVAGQGGIEKHADFMEGLVDLATDHEDELAARLGIENE